MKMYLNLGLLHSILFISKLCKFTIIADSKLNLTAKLYFNFQ